MSYMCGLFVEWNSLMFICAPGQERQVCVFPPAVPCDSDLCQLGWYAPMPILNGSVVYRVQVVSNGQGQLVPERRSVTTVCVFKCACMHRPIPHSACLALIMYLLHFTGCQITTLKSLLLNSHLENIFWGMSIKQ